MNITVQRDTTVRTIVFSIEPGSVPDLDTTERWHKRSRSVRPDKAILTLKNGVADLISIFGPFVRKDGSVSENVREKRIWSAPEVFPVGQPIEQAPEWIREIWERGATHY